MVQSTKNFRVLTSYQFKVTHLGIISATLLELSRPVCHTDFHVEVPTITRVRLCLNERLKKHEYRNLQYIQNECLETLCVYDPVENISIFIIRINSEQHESKLFNHMK